MQRIHPRDWLAQPWKNGGGTTHEIFRVGTATDFDLRLSVAEINGAQTFSRFDGYHRVLIPLDESKLAIVIAGLATPLLKHQCIEFPGNVNTKTIGTGHTRDFNVISRTETQAHVEVSTRESQTPTHRALALFALEKTVLKGNDGSQLELEEHETLVIASNTSVTYEASAPTIWIRF